MAKLREKQSAPRQYGLLARYYDQFFTFHHDWYRGARQKVLGKILLQVRSACDLACGTGTTAVELARLGIKVFAVDLSPVMCRLARQKAKRVRTRLRVLQGDMRTFRLPEPVDLITSEFDAVNHIPRKADLGRVAKAAARALRPASASRCPARGSSRGRSRNTRAWGTIIATTAAGLKPNGLCGEGICGGDPTT